MEGKVKTGLVASGGGTDGRAIMRGYATGMIPNIELMLMVSTKRGEKCLDKVAEVNNEFGLKIEPILIDRREAGSSDNFNDQLARCLIEWEIKLLFLVGCIVKIRMIEGIAIYNIHPADLPDCGGLGMYGLEPHKKVVSGIEDLISRGRKKIGDRFFTYPTVHEVDENYDSGSGLLRLKVEIPPKIIADYHEQMVALKKTVLPEEQYSLKEAALEEAASQLQKYVLPYEWAILPTAVKIAAQKIIDEKAETK